MRVLDNPLVSLITVSLFFIGVILLYHSSSYFSNQLIPSQKEPLCNQSNLTTTNVEGDRDSLDSALEKASLGNKTVIIAIVNKAYVEEGVESKSSMLDIFLSSFWVGEGTRSLIHHILLVAVDQIAYDRCIFLNLNCFRLQTDGVDFEGEKIYMSQDFIKMMWRRTQFLLQVLKRGYNFVFTDTDVMWLRNPFTRLSKNETEDLQISTDSFHGDPWSNRNLINTGFYFVRGGMIEHLGLRVRFLDTLYFSGFCEDSKDFRAVTTVHANCCRSIHAKILDLKIALSDWKRFRKLDANSTMNPQWTKHDWCWQSWGRPKQANG
ncbi:unnamed protein product [Sphenostylis stenocarpa]|uniref:Nucleotide-diphospho-sugar transferase domain-containing protein n=1 Tax=Sphenostylis stenocarpa TaxID=92480 RepID=A0AA86SA04_9FABA|nr:unnamed protein product [Sphenostylis stenocarpa]